MYSNDENKVLGYTVRNPSTAGTDGLLAGVSQSQNIACAKRNSHRTCCLEKTRNMNLEWKTALPWGLKGLTNWLKKYFIFTFITSKRQWHVTIWWSIIRKKHLLSTYYFLGTSVWTSWYYLLRYLRLSQLEIEGTWSYRIQVFCPRSHKQEPKQICSDSRGHVTPALQCLCYPDSQNCGKSRTCFQR